MSIITMSMNAHVDEIKFLLSLLLLLHYYYCYIFYANYTITMHVLLQDNVP